MNNLRLIVNALCEWRLYFIAVSAGEIGMSKRQEERAVFALDQFERELNALGAK